MVTGIDQRTQVCFGSKNEVARFEKYMFGEERARGRCVLRCVLRRVLLAARAACLFGLHQLRLCADTPPSRFSPQLRRRAVEGVKRRHASGEGIGGENMDVAVDCAAPRGAVNFLYRLSFTHACHTSRRVFRAV
jgi:hypothetical protein